MSVTIDCEIYVTVTIDCEIYVTVTIDCEIYVTVENRCVCVSHICMMIVNYLTISIVLSILLLTWAELDTMR